MTTKKNKSRIMLIIACVLSFVSLAVSSLGVIFVGFNIAGITDSIRKMLLNSGYAATELDGEITMMIFSFILDVIIELTFALFYFKAIKFKANSLSFARRLMSKAIWHLILGSLLPAVFAMISASMMSKQKTVVKPLTIDESLGDDYFARLAQS